MEQYNVTGMSCAACSSRVEKAVSKVPGVTSCSVSLLTNSMGVEGTASSADIIKAVQDAGYEEWMLWSAANKYHLEGLSADGSSAAAAEVSTETSEEGETAGEDADGTSEAESAAETAQQ